MNNYTYMLHVQQYRLGAFSQRLTFSIHEPGGQLRHWPRSKRVMFINPKAGRSCRLGLVSFGCLCVSV